MVDYRPLLDNLTPKGTVTRDFDSLFLSKWYSSKVFTPSPQHHIHFLFKLHFYVKFSAQQILALALPAAFLEQRGVTHSG
jgi:hypothetical protein